MTEQWSDLIRLGNGRYARKDYTDHGAWLLSEGLDDALHGHIVAWAYSGSGFMLSSTGRLCGMSDDDVLLRLLFDTAERIE